MKYSYQNNLHELILWLLQIIKKIYPSHTYVWCTFCLFLLLVFKKWWGASCIKPLGCLITVINSWEFWRYDIKSEFYVVSRGWTLLGDGCYAEFQKSLHHCKKLSTHVIIVHFKASRRSVNNLKWIDSLSQKGVLLLGDGRHLMCRTHRSQSLTPKMF